MKVGFGALQHNTKEVEEVLVKNIGGMEFIVLIGELSPNRI